VIKPRDYIHDSLNVFTRGVLYMITVISIDYTVPYLDLIKLSLGVWSRLNSQWSLKS